MTNERWTGPVIATIDMLLALFVVMLGMVNPVMPKVESQEKPFCKMAVDISWPKEMNTDVDLWVLAPGDRPVGYSNKSGRGFDLVRDDLGIDDDEDTVNSERACARFLVQGEYVANVHLYGNRSGRADVPVTLTVTKLDPYMGTLTTIEKREVVLKYIGQETTVIRFELDKDGKVVAGSENDIPKPLREAK